ncbi:hypothetical protein EYF80_068154 [Liparis tanakae]|uniref:Uncharacterized protein n=1 Tax=Liparis tanakae TaxID=230148 RepID=A0A4Z2DYW2_9TELE|nr:hypothetical protein EYF80_068154 [Liparis tanakae]
MVKLIVTSPEDGGGLKGNTSTCPMRPSVTSHRSNSENIGRKREAEKDNLAEQRGGDGVKFMIPRPRISHFTVCRHLRCVDTEQFTSSESLCSVTGEDGDVVREKRGTSSRSSLLS